MAEETTETIISADKKALREAVAKARVAMIEKPSRETMDTFSYASKLLNEFTAPNGNQQEKIFRNMLEVVDYLQGQGWKIHKSKAYGDRKAGRIKPQTDGTFLASDADKYAAYWLDPLSEAEMENVDQNRKLKAEADKQEAQAKWWGLKTEIESGRYVRREEMEEQLAARAAFLKTDFENFFRSHATEMVIIVTGDQAKTPDLLAFGLSAVGDWLDRYAKQGEFTV